MPARTIQNVAGKFGATATPAGRDVDWFVNGSGGSLATGDVVVLSGTAGTTITTTTSASNLKVVGVVGTSTPSDLGASRETFAASANTPVVLRGPARINIAANTVADGANLSTSAAAKVAATAANAADVAALQALSGSFIATALEADGAKDSNNTIRCWIQKR